MLEKSPDDPFLLYALGMEMKKTDVAAALELFHRVIQVDPGQCYAYYQLGQTHEAAHNSSAAQAAYRDGLAAAGRVGDEHARQEITAALEALA